MKLNIPAPSFTKEHLETVMNFSVSAFEFKKVLEWWDKKHPGEPIFWHGAPDGGGPAAVGEYRVNFQFAMTGLGQVVKVIDSTDGEVFDATDYDMW